MDFNVSTTVVAVASGVVAVLAVTLAAIAHRSLRRLTRAVAILDQGDSAETVLEHVAQRTLELRSLQQDAAKLRATLDATRIELGSALRHVAVVRYDAFGDMGGRMSFSTALLDDNGDGLLITSIHGRSGTRTYMKPVAAGGSDQISPEEQEAIHRATGRTK
ncbi:MAG: DUF4446 family protein [Actinobacteria bacterium]|nr:DUF4446 family protein [Actinomycetota bacterium]